LSAKEHVIKHNFVPEKVLCEYPEKIVENSAGKKKVNFIAKKTIIIFFRQ
jgi:hypothetical protein